MTDWRPPTDLAVLLQDGRGERFRLDPKGPDAERQPSSLSFETSNEGFGPAQFRLRREAGHDYGDLTVLNDVLFMGQDGSTAYQGRLQSAPTNEALEVAVDGWVSALRQRDDLRELIVDRDATRFGDIPQYRREVLLALNAVPDKSITGTAGNGTVTFTSEAGQQIPNGTHADLAYLAPLGAFLNGMGYNGTEANLGSIAAPVANACQSDGITSQDQQAITLDGTERFVSFGTPKPMLILRAVCNGTFTPAVGAGFRRIIQPSVWGATGITRRSRADGLSGVYASDAIRYLTGKYAPRIDLSRVQDTTYPIPHLVWHDPTTLQAMLQQINSFHSWRLAVWENRMLEFGPYDYGKADWKVANGINGVQVETVGDTSENQFNGAVVNYTAFDGTPSRVGPWTSADLRDDSDWIAANQWGDQAYLSVDVSWNCSTADAVLIGAIALADANRAQRPCRITIPYHAQTPNGTWEPAWKVRADQTISVMNEAFPGPRLITSTTWSDNQVVVSTDNAVNTLEAVQNRVMSQLSAAGIGGA